VAGFSYLLTTAKALDVRSIAMQPMPGIHILVSWDAECWRMENAGKKILLSSLYS